MIPAALLLVLLWAEPSGPGRASDLLHPGCNPVSVRDHPNPALLSTQDPGAKGSCSLSGMDAPPHAEVSTVVQTRLFWPMGLGSAALGGHASRCRPAEASETPFPPHLAPCPPPCPPHPAPTSPCPPAPQPNLPTSPCPPCHPATLPTSPCPPCHPATQPG